MHQTWRFKRINGTAYPDSIASILRDASGEKLSRLAESSNASEPMFAYEDREVPQRKRSIPLVGGGGASRGRRLTDAGIRTRSHPDFCGAWQTVTTTAAGLGTPGGLKISSRQRPIDRDRKALFPETRLGRSRRFDLAHRTEPVEVERVPRGSYCIDLDFGELSRAERRLRR